jgi:hypothetical protein
MPTDRSAVTIVRSGRMGTSPSRLRPAWAAAAGVAVVLLSVPRVQGLQNGITGYSGKQGATCNDSCHQGGATPLVRFEGPTRVMADAIATFRFVVTSQASKQKVAGFNVAADDGMLGVVAGQDGHVEFDELTHDAPKPNVNGEASWEFTWQAPSQPGMYTLYGAGVSANGNGTNGGDDSDLTSLDVTVVSGPIGDANCDARVTAADTTAVVALLPGGVLGDCTGADVNGDGGVTAADVPLVIAALFGE